MSNLDETAYPRLRDDISPQELDQLYTPSAKERKFVTDSYRRTSPQTFLILQLKLMQRLGHSVPLASVPLVIVAHVCKKFKIARPSKDALARYDASGEKSRHLQQVVTVLKLQEVDQAARRWMVERAEAAARTKQELPDIINALLEELVHQRYVLPGFSYLDRIAQAARDKVNTAIQDRIVAALDQPTRDRLDALLGIEDDDAKPQGEESPPCAAYCAAYWQGWDRIKREPGKPTAREVVAFLQHIRWLRELAQGLPDLYDVAATKRAQLILEARALDISEMRSLVERKRYALTVLLIQSQLRKATDDIAEIFVKTVRKLDTDANMRLREYRVEHALQVDRLVGQLREVLTAYNQDDPEVDRLAAIGGSLVDEPRQLIEECDEYMAYADNNYFPFMLRPYGTKRALLFECLDVMQPMATYRDDAFGQALTWMLRHRNSHKEYLQAEVGQTDLDLAWLPVKWRHLIVGKGANMPLPQRLHRKYFELCLFSRLHEELQSGDLFVPRSELYDDYRNHFVDQATFQAELNGYVEMLGLESDGRGFCEGLRNKLTALAEAVDQEFPQNAGVAWGPNGLLIRKVESDVLPEGFDALDQAVNEGLGHVNVLEALIQTEGWLNLHKMFGPLSGFESKLDDPRARFIATLFCYGFNMGASQTARSLKSFSRKQIAWLNLRHVTEDRLDKAITKTVNAYHRFGLPKYWGSGKSASADGTKWSMYEKNLLSEYHIRYGGYGGIGYYHVSDTYIALFSHFIPCGVYEAVYILDGLIRNDSDIQPDTVHGDTQAQNTPVFALAHLLGIELMPRIRNVKDLIFFKPGKDAKYQNIQSLFRGEAIDWDLIERHYEDMLRVAVSIKAGMITPSTLLRRLGSKSRKNKLYFAFRELGRVLRTMFLLRYISEPQLRRTIHATTNKSEQFNHFAQWTFFGGEGTIAENVRHEQRKVIKYNHLVANMLILNNVHRMSKVVGDLQQSGKFVIDAKMAAHLSPYRTIHLNRFGVYPMDLNAPVEPMNLKVKISTATTS
ncbi:Tn3 family transposase [Variovorax sp. ZS18.2.2]|uniref:Tn3 family transposase n=1 Tax=Variovorax sp. ZS18.2.2 TaxID=2971255 RepID=UPI0021518DAE|nr:Tn3 family transposase [Variovorax sp. ZS18.2.2]MCR6475960.1 Tn3 family transposase [Variovorax sp. ZS18.2.2]